MITHGKLRAAHDNRRAAGAVCIIRDQHFVSPENPQECCRPGGEASCLFRVFFGLQKFRVNSCSFVVKICVNCLICGFLIYLERNQKTTLVDYYRLSTNAQVSIPHSNEGEGVCYQFKITIIIISSSAKSSGQFKLCYTIGVFSQINQFVTLRLHANVTMTGV